MPRLLARDIARSGKTSSKILKMRDRFIEFLPLDYEAQCLAGRNVKLGNPLSKLRIKSSTHNLLLTPRIATAFPCCMLPSGTGQFVFCALGQFAWRHGY